jgi:uncharacterized protein (TIGR02757 family)
MPSASSPAKDFRLSEKSVERLKADLSAFLASPHRGRIAFDPIEFPHRYSHPRDIEVAALLSASLAYGRADLFRPKVNALLLGMGSSPAAFVSQLTPKGAGKLLRGFVYRFNVGTDIAVLLMGIGRILRKCGSVEAWFVEQLRAQSTLHGALSGFTAGLRDVPMAPLRRELGPERGLDHLMPSPLGPGAAKRLNLFLRWMVRGPDGVDFGIWPGVSTSILLIPVDTHVGRIARYLGLTRRTDLSWKTAEEITAALRKVDPEDPVRFDFALCHHGMSGACPPIQRLESCSCCLLLPSCRVGRRLLARNRRECA